MNRLVAKLKKNKEQADAIKKHNEELAKEYGIRKSLIQYVEVVVLPEYK